MNKENCCSNTKPKDTNCECNSYTSSENCCSDKGNLENDKQKNIKIFIDEKEIEVSDTTKNIVDVAKDAGINIPAPCYFAKRKGGCCKACVVEVDGKQSYACGTKPVDGIKITVNRNDLISLRKERILEYKKNIKNGITGKCSCS